LAPGEKTGEDDIKGRFIATKMSQVTARSGADSTVAHNSLAAFWGAAGVVGICAFAIWRITPHALGALDYELSPLQWVALVANVLFMAWSEGYRGFQQKFSPRAAARALYLYRTATPWWTKVLAPLFCFGYFQATRRAMLVAWVGTIGIAILVLLIYQLDQPWRGIIDAGVVVGLTWGVIALIASYIRAFSTGEYQVSPELPETVNSEKSGLENS
jgi:hypothetical protein